MGNIAEREAECGHALNLPGRHAVRVEGILQPRRGAYNRARGFLICSDCWQESVNEYGLIPRDASVNDRLNQFNYGNNNQVMGLYGGTTSTGVRQCEGCGLLVERGYNPRTQVHTCSRACTVRVSKKRHSVSATVTRTCSVCGTELTGRADQRYCSNRCRQHAHRFQPVTPERAAEIDAHLAELHTKMAELPGWPT